MKKLTVSDEVGKKLGELEQHFDGRLTRSQIVEEIVEYFHAGIVLKSEKKIIN